jgi:hypothetical protein
MKSEWPGINAKGTVLINLAYETFDLTEGPLTLDSIAYTPKDELHVTLVGEKVGAILQNKIELLPRTSELLGHVFDDIDWSFKRSGPLHVLSRQNKNSVQKSIIMLIDMPGVASFYHQLKLLELIPDDTAIPPAHVTLYTHNCPTGIGVPSENILNSLSEKSFSVESFNRFLSLRSR